MSQPLWSKLLVLVDTDKELSSLRKKIVESQALIIAGNSQIAKMEKQKNSFETQIKNKTKEIKVIEAKSKQANNLEKNKQNILKASNNLKNYNATEKELKTLSIDSQKFENILITEWQALETLEKKLLKQEALISEAKNTLDESITSLKKAVDEINQSIKALETKRISQIENIPKTWLSQYEKMKNKADNPVVSIINSSCSHCYYKILPQDLSKMKKGILLSCKSCFRLLYHPADIETSTETETSY